MRPDAVVFPKIIDSPRFFQRHQGPNGSGYRPAVFVLPTEAEGRPLSETPHVNTLAPIDLVLAWNRDQASQFANQYGLDPDQIVVTGNPRFDWYHDRWRGSWDDRPEILRRLGVPQSWTGAIVTVSGSFPLADTDEEKLARRIQQSSEYGLGDTTNLHAGVDDADQHREALLELIIRAREAIQDVWFLVKPHPMERADRYRKVLGGKDRIGVLTQEYPFIFLSVSDLHIHHRCTTSTEARLLGVPAVDYAPTELSREVQPWRSRGSLRTEHGEEVLESIRTTVAGRFELPQHLEDEGKSYARELFSDDFGMSGRSCARAIHGHLTRVTAGENSRASGFRAALYERWFVDTFRTSGEAPARYLSRLPMHLPYQLGKMVLQLARGQISPAHTVGRPLTEAETELWLERASISASDLLPSTGSGTA